MEDKMSEPHAERSGLSLLNGIAALFNDYSDLVQKEIRLARAEIVEAVTSQLRSGALMAAAGFLGLIAFLLIIEGIVFAIASAGLGLYWSCFLVALVLLVGAAGLYFYARSSTTKRPLLGRSIEQVRRDIRTVKEQAT
jgi:Flp pilus assembly protein TadB